MCVCVCVIVYEINNDVQLNGANGMYEYEYEYHIHYVITYFCQHNRIPCAHTTHFANGKYCCWLYPNAKALFIGQLAGDTEEMKQCVECIRCLIHYTYTQ